MTVSKNTEICGGIFVQFNLYGKIKKIKTKFSDQILGNFFFLLIPPRFGKIKELSVLRFGCIPEFENIYSKLCSSVSVLRHRCDCTYAPGHKVMA